MKKIYSIFSFFFLLGCLMSCQNEEELGNSAMGYLRLGLEVNTTSISRAEAEAYNPKQLAVQIVDASDKVVDETTNFDTEWKNKTIALPVGTYTIKASSAGFDGKTSGFDKPYYVGSTEVVIEDGKTANPKITCTLANVKVTVTFDQTFIDAFTAADVKVDDKGGDAGISPLTFTMGKTTQSGYFPVTDLKATVSATNKHQVTNTQTDEITGVKARDHYKLLYKVGKVDQGNGSVSITVDETTRTYTYVVTISTAPKTEPTMTISSVNAWAKLAYLEGTVEANGVNMTSGIVAFQYRKKDATSWSIATASLDNETYKTTITELEPETKYECRMVYNENVFIGNIKEFTTEIATPLQNGDFEDWCTIKTKPISFMPEKDTAFPNASSTSTFWDTSNAGANVLGTIDPTNKTTDFIVSGTYAAKLQSQSVSGLAFAAASLYTGTFGSASLSMTATLKFGQAFTARPIALHGYYQYTPVNVDNVGDNLPSDATVSKGNPDQCAIYIALAKKSYEINNGDPNTFIDFENDNNIIAYGTIEGDYVDFGEKTTESGYTEFTIPLQYKESQFNEIPTHIIIVCSASKYGDYMTGGNGSTLYVDKFSLIYDGKPAIQE